MPPSININVILLCLHILSSQSSEVSVIITNLKLLVALIFLSLYFSFIKSKSAMAL